MHLAVREALVEHQTHVRRALRGTAPQFRELSPRRAQVGRQQVGARQARRRQQVVASDAALVQQGDQEARGD